MAKKTTKWVRDTNGDRHCAWHLVNTTDENADDPIASVFPEWEGTARMSGRPSGYKAVTCQYNPDAGTFNVLGTYPTIRAATRAIELHNVLPLVEGTRVTRLSTGETGVVISRIPDDYDGPMYRVQVGGFFGTFTPSEIGRVS